VKVTRMLIAAATAVVALGVTVFIAAPAEAAVTRSFSESSDDGAGWGSVTFNNDGYSWSVDAYILRDSNASIKLEVCGWYSDWGAWYILKCKYAYNGGRVGSIRHVTDLGASANWARVGGVTAYLYVNGTFVDGDWIFP